MAYRLRYESNALLRKRYLHNDYEISAYDDQFSLRQAIKVKKRIYSKSYGVCKEQDKINGSSFCIDGASYDVGKPQ
jgi:hypothetical protein